MRFKIICITAGICLSVNVNSQTLRLLDFFESTDNPKFKSKDFNKLGIRRSAGDSSFYLSSIKKNRFIIKAPKSAIFEVFDNNYLVISIKSPEKYPNGQPNFSKARDSVFIIDLERKGNKRQKIYKTFVDGKTICSNAIELINLNKKISYDYALKSISLSSGSLVLLNLATLKDEELKMSE